MATFDVKTTSLNIFPQGDQEEQVIQNRGPDPVFLDSNSALSATSIQLSAGQSITWARKLPLFAVSAGFSRIIVARNASSPNVITDRYLPIGIATYRASGQSWNGGTPAASSPFIGAGSYRTLLFVINKGSDMVFDSTYRLTLVWDADDGTGLQMHRSDAYFVYPGVNPTLVALVRVRVRGPRFKWFLTKQGNLPLDQNALISVFGSFEDDGEGVGFPPSYNSTGASFTDQTDWDGDTFAFTFAANPTAIWYIPCPKNLVRIRIQTGNVLGAAGGALAMEGGYNFNNAGAIIMQGMIGNQTDLEIAAGGFYKEATYYVSRNTFLMLFFNNGVVATPNSVGAVRLTFFD